MSVEVLTGRRLPLADVTLVAATSVAIEPTAAAISRSLAQVEFASALWLSDQAPPASIADRVEWRKIRRLSTRSDYSRLMLYDLVGHVATSHVLCVQWDGFVLDATAWSSDFLDYDYIGAPWPHFDDGFIVGNGGFSLRSRKLLQSVADLVKDVDEAEDLAICRTWRPVLEACADIRFGTPEIASRFAYERSRPSGKTFGFHGIFNLVELIEPAMLSGLIAQLEPNLLASNEQHEVMRWALRHGRWRVVWLMLQRMRIRQQSAHRD
jgi:hypothetical protein